MAEDARDEEKNVTELQEILVGRVRVVGMCEIGPMPRCLVRCCSDGCVWLEMVHSD